VERSLAWLSRFRQLGRDLERLCPTLSGFHFVAACVLLLTKLRPVLGEALHQPLEKADSGVGAALLSSSDLHVPSCL